MGFNEEKIKFLGEVALAAGVGKDAVKISFERNEAGKCTEVIKHLKDGNVQPLDTKYFQNAAKEIKNKIKDKKLSNQKFRELDILKCHLKKVDSIFKTSAFKGPLITGQKTESRPINATPSVPKSVQITPTDSTEDQRMNKVRDSALEETKAAAPVFQPEKNEATSLEMVEMTRTLNTIWANKLKAILKKKLGSDPETVKLIVEFVRAPPIKLHSLFFYAFRLSRQKIANVSINEIAKS